MEQRRLPGAHEDRGNYDYPTYEVFSLQRSLDAFHSEFGVLSPVDEDYDPDEHGQFGCSLCD